MPVRKSLFRPKPPIKKTPGGWDMERRFNSKPVLPETKTREEQLSAARDNFLRDNKRDRLKMIQVLSVIGEAEFIKRFGTKK